jgi:septal ring factor EnvC (AmiA/AmiB activator)
MAGLFPFAQTVCCFILIPILGLVSVAAARGQEHWAIVAATGLHLRQAPSRQGRSLTILPKGTRFKVVAQTPGWLKASVDGQIGYLSSAPDNVRMAAATDPSAGDIDALRRQAVQLDRQITQRQAEVVEITAMERATLAELDAVEQRLSQAQTALVGLQARMKRLTEAILENDQAIMTLTSESRQVQAKAARRLKALYKLHWIGRLQVLASAATVSDLIIREKALRRILAADEATLGKFYQQRQALETRKRERSEQQRHQAALEAELETRLRETATERDQRQRILAAIRDRKALELASLEALHKAAARLDQAIEHLSQDPVAGQAATVSPDSPFHARKGLLRMPVSGRIIHFFGPYRNPRFNVINVRGGIDIRAEKGEPIRAVHGGRVLYASWFKGYGNMMIIDHGDAYYTVYAHAEEMFKTIGALVETGEVIATVGDSGSLDGALLHFEVRHRGKPQDPLGWLQAG